MLSEKPWRGEAVLAFCAGVLACLFTAMTAASALHRLKVAGFLAPDDPGYIVAGTLGFQGATWLLALVFLKQHRVDWRGVLGWRDRNWKPVLAFAGKTTLLALPCIWLLQETCVRLLTAAGRVTEPQEAVRIISAADSTWLSIYLGVFAVVVAPVAEEFIFRGVLFSFVKQLGFPRTAWFGVSALFALIHADLPTFLPLFALALVLTWLYDKTGCLLAPIAAHALFNAANLALLYAAPYFDRPPAN